MSGEMHMNAWYAKSVKQVLGELETDRERGLSPAEAGRRLERWGPNELARQRRAGLLRRFLGQMKDPMILVLLAAAGLSLWATGGEDWLDAAIILVIVAVNACISISQEDNAEKALEALRQMSAPLAKVLRDGKEIRLETAALVPGDIIRLEAGDLVPADARILTAAGLRCDESAMTGEPVPAAKAPVGELPEDTPLADRRNMVLSGTVVTGGRALCVITATGMDTEMGRIADALQKAEQGQTPLQIKLSQLSKILTWLVLGICVVIFGVQVLRAGGFTGQVILDSFLVAVSLAVAAIPEGLAAVVTVVLSIGVTNMSKRNAIIRRLTAVETLGCAQIICSDKTGTLTQNKMTVVDHYGPDENLLATAMSLCSDAEEDENGEAVGEPTECALVNWAHGLGLDKDDLKACAPRIGEAPFDSVRKMMSTVHASGGSVVQYTKGAPDEVLKRCVSYLDHGEVCPMTDAKRQEILAANKGMADRALRVLAAAARWWKTEPTDFAPEKLEQELCFIGLTGMIDPVRPEVKAAIEECRGAGIRPIMITGDHIDTAVAIAKELGILKDASEAVTGSQLDAMDDEEFERRFRDISVYARVQPEHKTRIVTAWKKAGCVTAMTGDGVNDAPSIKSADIGVGMGITGTDVTKNVADMVLADDNFATIVGAVEEGRRIYDNIRKAIQFLLGSNMSEVISIFVATLLGFSILQPVHLLWINLVTDCFPALALGMERAEADIMRRKPRDAKAGVFAGGMGADIAYQGIVVSLLTLASYFVGHFIESGVWEIANSADGTTMAFLTMSMAEICHSFNMRSQRGSLFTLKGMNKALNWAALGSLFATTLVCEVPFLANAFGFAPVDFIEYVVALCFAVSIIPIVEIVKFFQRKAEKRR